MDMKRILQAVDSVATNPVVGADSMTRFLRVVKEAEINQVPAMPDTSGIQPGTSKDLGDGSKITVNQDGTVSYQGGWGTYVYNAQGQHIKTDSPSFAGYQQSSDTQGNVTKNYNQGPLSLQQGPQGTTASYDLGVAKVGTQTNAQGQTTTTVQENSISKFLSIVNNNDVSLLTEGANPHKVTLPVQMAMQHYQEPTKILERKSSGIYKYFAQVEEEQLQEQTEKRQLINQYASQIAQRVLGKDK